MEFSSFLAEGVRVASLPLGIGQQVFLFPSRAASPKVLCDPSVLSRLHQTYLNPRF